MAERRSEGPRGGLVIARPWQDAQLGLVAVPDKHFACTITDPPYSAYVHKNKWSGSAADGGTPGAKPVTFAALSLEELRAVAAEIVRTTAKWALIFCADDDIHNWREALSAAGALRWVTCVWMKPNGAPQFRGEGPSQPCEYIVTAWCGGDRPEWNGGGKLGVYNVPVEAAGARDHETQKPLRLIKNLVLDFTAPGDLLADPYAGSGTLGVAAKETGRDFVLWDQDRVHVATAKRRVSRAREQLAFESLLHRARPQAFGKAVPEAPLPEQLDLE